MKTATLLFIIKDDQVILAEKKVGEIGKGTLNGPGGKLEEGETYEECAARETKEELDLEVYPDLLDQVAHIVFYAAGEPDFDVHIFTTDEVQGDLVETNEAMKPAWYSLDAIPFERMLDSDRAWLEKVFAGEHFSAKVYYRERAKGFERIEFSKPHF